MSALIADRNTPLKDAELIPVPVAAGVNIRAGALVVATATGFAAPGTTSATVTYLGRAEAAIDNTGGADGAKTVLVRRKKAFKWANLAADPVAQADLFKTCYIADDQTVAKSNGGNTRSAAGRVVQVEADGIWVE